MPSEAILSRKRRYMSGNVRQMFRNLRFSSVSDVSSPKLPQNAIMRCCSGVRYDTSASSSFICSMLRSSMPASIMYLSIMSKSASSISPQK